MAGIGGCCSKCGGAYALAKDTGKADVRMRRGS